MFDPILKQLARGLSSRQIPYMVIGGQAVLIYGEPRLTRDVDVTLGVGVDRLADVQAMAEELHWKALPRDPVAFARETFVLPCQDVPTGIRIDLIFSATTYEREAIGRSRSVDVGGEPVRYATVDDLIVHKILAGRPRDLEDVRSIAHKNRTIDKAFIEKTLAEMGPDLAPELQARFRELFG